MFKYVFLPLILGLILVGCKKIPPVDTEQMLSRFTAEETLPQPHDVRFGERNVRYYTYGNPNGQPLVFIHGSPGGGWELFAEYFDDPGLNQDFYMISVDRLGFGGSDFGNPERSLEQHAGAVAAAITNATDKPAIIVGHSYGGPVQIRLGIDHPELVKAQISLAPSVSPDLEKNRWYNTLAGVFFVRPFLPETWDTSNQEILPLKGELEIMQPLMSQLNSPITVIHGTADPLVPVGNAQYIKDNAVNAKVQLIILEGQNHFLPWNEYALIKQAILEN